MCVLYCEEKELYVSQDNIGRYVLRESEEKAACFQENDENVIKLKTFFDAHNYSLIAIQL